MNVQRLAGAIAVLALTTGIGITIASLATSNGLLTGSLYVTAVATTVVVFTVAFMLFILAGQPRPSWRRTPYW